MAFLSNIQHLLNGVDIDNLMREINSLKREISSAKKEISRYSTSLTEKYNEVASLKQQNVSLSEDMTRERNKYSILEGKADDLRKTIIELKKENEILGTSEQKFKDDCEKTAKSNASLNGKNLALTNKVKALEEKITQLESIQLRQQSELSEKDSKMSMMEANYDKLQSDYNNTKEQLEDANRTIEDEKTAKKGLEENLVQLQEGNRILSEKSDSLQVAVDELASENSRLRGDSAKAKEKIDLLTEESSSKESEKTALREELDKQKTENDSLQQQIQELVAEKEELSPYMYLVEAKKEQEAIESAIKEARENLQKSWDSAISILSTITHEEVKNSLEDAIKSSRELVDSVDCTLEELNDSKESIDSASKIAVEQEKDLIEQEEAERKRREEEEAERKRKEQEEAERLRREEEEEKKRQEEEKKHKEQELKKDLERLVGTAKSFCNTISYDDISMPLQTVIDNTEIYIEAGLFEYNTLENKYTTLKNALDEAKKEVESAKKTESHVVKRSILEIFDTKEGDIIESETFFKRPEHELVRWRRIFEESILYGEHRFICTNCRQDVKISGRKFERGQVAFFSHLHDSDFCEIKTTTGLSKEQIEARKYGLVCESERHKRLKRLIHEALEGYYSRKKGIENVVEEKRVNSDIPYLNWRRPDVMADYKDMHLVFELQLSTTFVSVVVQRDIFYRLNDYFIIWVFNFDDNQKYVDLTNLMCKDIYYANKRNVFIFDQEAQQESEERGELVLKCNWLDVDNTWHYSHTKGNGDGVLITLDELKFDKETCKPYYFDAETPYYEIHPSVKERILKEEKTKQDMLDSLQSRAKREAEEAIIKRDAALKDMVENNGAVTPFKDGNRYGFKYNNVVLVPARYSSYTSFGEKGMFKVSFNRHYGLIDRYGNELFPCNYLDFHHLSNGVIIAESTSGFYMSGIGSISGRSPHDQISLKYVSLEISILQHNSCDLNVFIIDDELILKKDYNGYSFFLISGEKKTDVVYSEIRFTKNNSALWLKNADSKLWMIAELNGTQRNDNLYVECTFENNATFAKTEGKCDVYNPDGDLLISTDYDEIEDFDDFELYKVYKDNFIGLVNLQFEEVLPVVYSEIEICGIFIIAKKDEQWGLFNKDGVVLSETVFSEIELFKSYDSNWKNWLLIKKDEKCGLYNDLGKLVVNPMYDSLTSCDEFVITILEEKQGLINKEGLILLENQYDNIESLRNGHNLKCQIENKSYLFLNDTLLLLEQYYDSIEKLTNCHLTAKVGDHYGLLDITGHLCIPFEYDQIDMICHLDDDSYVFKCKKNGYVCAFDIQKQKEIISANYDDIKHIAGNDLYGVKSNDCWGLYKLDKGLITNVKYSQITFKNDDTIAVSIIEDGVVLQGHLDMNGNEVFSSEMKSEDGLYIKEFFGKWGVYNEKGDILLPLEIMESMSFTNQKEYFKVCKEGKYGIKHISGKYVVNPECRDIISIADKPFWILQLIRHKTEQRSKSVPSSSYSYSWGRRRYYTSYRTQYYDVTVEYNPFKLVKIDGSQTGFSEDIRGEFSSMSFILKDYVIADNRLISLGGLNISAETYTNYSPFEENDELILSEANGTFGLLSSTLNVIVPCKYSHITTWGKNLFLATVHKKNFYGEETYYNLYNRDGVLCSIGNMSAIETLENGKAKVEKDGKFGYIDDLGNVVPDNISKVDEHIVTKEAFGKLEVFDNHGNRLFSYNDNITLIETLSEGYYKVKKQNNWSLYDLKENKILFSDIQSMTDCKNGLYIISNVSTSALLDSSFTEIIPFSLGYSYMRKWSDSKFVAAKRSYSYYGYNQNLFVILDNKGNILTESEYSKIGDLENGRAEVVLNGKTGFITESCKVISDIVEERGEWAISKSFDTFCLTKDNNKILQDLSDASFFSKTIVKFKKHGNYHIKLFSIVDEKDLSNEYSSLSPLDGEYANAIKSNGLKGKINTNGQEYVETIEEKSNWKIVKSFERFSIYNETASILTDLWQASFVCDNLIKYKGSQKSLFKLYSISTKETLLNSYKSIDLADDGKIIAVNANNLSGTLDEEGNEMVDETIELQSNIVAKRIFSRYVVLINDEVVLSELQGVYLWKSDCLNVRFNNSKCQLYDVLNKKLISKEYQSISSLKEGKAEVRRNGMLGYIDSEAHELPSYDIVINDNLHKVCYWDYWHIVDNNGKDVLNESFREIGSYKGRYIKFSGSDFRVMDTKSPKVIPVTGVFYKQCPATIIYLVGGHYVRVQHKSLDLKGKSVSDFINENRRLKLAISYINFKKQAVYAKPYKELPVRQELPPYDIGQVVRGEIKKILPFGIRIKCEDGRITLIHISRLEELGYSDHKFEPSQMITIKKTGFDEAHQNDIWEIVSF